jgi:hypothetical protein
VIFVRPPVNWADMTVEQRREWAVALLKALVEDEDTSNQHETSDE